MAMMKKDGTLEGAWRSMILHVLCLMLTLTLLAPWMIASEAPLSGGTAVHAAARTYAYTGVHTGVGGFPLFQCNGMKGTCCEPADSLASSGKAGLKRLSDSDIRTKISYYWGYRKNYINRRDSYDALHYTWALQYACDRAGFEKGHNAACIKTAREMAEEARNQTVPSGVFLCYECSPTNKPAQTFVVWKWMGKGSLEITKTAKDTATLKDSDYSLKGAVIEVHEGSKSGKVVAKFTVGKKAGGSKSFTLMAGTTYWIKETTPGEKGYKVNTNWFSRAVKEGKTSSVTIRNSSINTPDPEPEEPVKYGRVRIRKALARDGLQRADLSGFRFLLINVSDSEECYEVGPTGADGTASREDIPYGTYSVEEIETPQGNFISQTEDAYITIDADHPDGDLNPLVWTNYLAEDAGSLEAYKTIVDPAGKELDTSAEGFRFVLVDQSDTSKQYAAEGSGLTDALGTIRFSNIPPGTYTLREVLTDAQKRKYTDLTGDIRNIEIRSNQTTRLPQSATSPANTGPVNQTDSPPEQPPEETGTFAYVKKTLSADSDAGGSPAGFSFTLTNAENRALRYSFSGSAATGEDGKTAKIQVEPGTYILTENLTGGQSENYTDVTGSQTVTIEKGQTVCIEHKNRYTGTPSQARFCKSLSADSSPGGQAGGFYFRLTNTETEEAFTFYTDRGSDQESFSAWQEVPAGTYRAEELPGDESYESVSEPRTITIAPGASVTIPWVNRYDPPQAKIKIRKRLTDTSAPGGTVEGFRFNIYRITENGETFICSRSTGADGSIPAFETEPGTYRIEEELTEAQARDYRDRTGPMTRTIAPGEEAVFVATNHYGPEKTTGSAAIQKVLEEGSDEGGIVKGFRFVLTRTDADTDQVYAMTTDQDGYASLDGIPYGTYRVAEVMTDAQLKTYIDATKKIEFTLNKDHPSETLVWTNRYLPDGSVSLQKKLSDRSSRTGKGRTGGFHFRFTNLSDRAMPPIEKVTDSAGRLEAEDLPFGTYEITEILTEEQKEHYIDETIRRQITLDKEHPNADIEWENTFLDTGSLHLQKRLESGSANKGGSVEGFSFLFKSTSAAGPTFTRTTDGAGAIDISGVPFGTYIVSELLTPEQEKQYTSITPESQRIVISEDAPDGYLTWTNAFADSGRVRLIKKLHEDSAAGGSVKGFRFQLTDKETGEVRADGETDEEGEILLTGIPFGTYLVRELLTDRQKKYYTDLTGEQEITLSKERPAQIIRRSNRYDRADFGINIEKHVLGLDIDPDRSFTFHVDIENLEESSDGSGYISPPVTVYPDGAKAGAGGLQTPAFSEPASIISEDHTRITVSLRDGDTAQIRGLTAGTRYRVTEEQSDYIPSYQIMQMEGRAEKLSDIGTAGSSLSTGEGVLTNTTGNGTAIYAFYNRARVEEPRNQLVISKETTDGNDETQFDFGVSITKAGGSKAYELLKEGNEENAGEENLSAERSFETDADGNAEIRFSLRAGERVMIPDLPAGAGYRVEEEASRYAASYRITRYDAASGAVGRLAHGDGEAKTAFSTGWQQFPKKRSLTDTIAFTNAADTGRLIVTKTSSERDDPAVFDYLTRIYGLSREKYIGFVPGEESFTLETKRSGDIRVTAIHSQLFSGGDLSGIPVRIIRPDGKAKTLYTDAAGMIGAELYSDWLAEGAASEFDYSIEFLDQTATGHFADTGD